MFASFALERVDVGEAELRVRHGGAGPPVVLLHVLWSARDDMEELYGDPIPIWSAWCDDVRAGTIDSGHHMAEEAPEELAAALLAFLATR